ncbi:hypothetical protein [Sphingosinicella sp. BN140058]|uniref:hypothetical protein n=1 Tax=Sphingosinicella sp. BN140058 TaxID=1892855 RepID=UPI001011A249|nr:hypothetical protein [Sphingosinicella sp. BN140058]QAY80286.1 hypothetical protein ETR14_26960 [Sphingosinicella sp. BN140058]
MVATAAQRPPHSNEQRLQPSSEKLKLAADRFLNSVAGDIPAAALDSALAAKDTIGFLVAMLRAAPVSNSTDERLREQQLHAARFKREMADAAGGLFDAAEVADLLGYKSKNAVYKAAAERRIFAVDDGGRHKFPTCQFKDSAPLPGLREVLAAAPNTVGWRILQYLLVPEEGLDGRRPIDLLRSGTSSDRNIAVRFAARLED